MKESNDNGTSEALTKACDFGVLIERGKSIFENISMVTIVPRFIISSKLSYNIDIRRAIITAENVNPYEIVDLSSGSSTCFHFTSIPDKLLEIRENHNQPLHNLTSASFDDHDATRWYGEVDITVLGISYVKLRNKTVKIEVELVGASLVATFMEQENDRWPPYRLENHTSLNIRFCQQDSKENKVNNDVNKSTKANRTANDHIKSLNSNDPNTPSSIFSSLMNPLYSTDDIANQAGWDLLPSRNIYPYYWDRPNTAEKSLRLEFAQGGQWEGIDIPLDQINLYKVMELHRALPELTNPIIEGYLMRKEFGNITILYITTISNNTNINILILLRPRYMGTNLLCSTSWYFLHV